MVYGKIYFFIILTLMFLFLLLGRCYAFLCQWQVLLPGRCHMPSWNYGRCYCQEVDIFLLFYEWQMLLPFYYGRCLYHYSILQLLYWLMLLPSGRWNGHILLLFVVGQMLSPCGRWNSHTFILCVVMAEVIAQWQMEWPLQGVSVPSW